MLSDKFPPDFLARFTQSRGVSPGDVLYLHCDFTTPPKMKYMVVVCCEPLLVLLINSEISRFIMGKPDLLSCQVDLAKNDHDFLEWDSVVSCIEAHTAFNLEALQKRIATEYGKILKGRITNERMRAVRIAVNDSPVMVRKHKKMILEALEHYQ
ncbi:hypothetical protein AA449_26900 [Salmonella enterica subsp. enterica serovar Newport]|nr:hypothetical protein [Salmonella enterica subsp. enterica serovar Newport]